MPGSGNGVTGPRPLAGGERRGRGGRPVVVAARSCGTGPPPDDVAVPDGAVLDEVGLDDVGPDTGGPDAAVPDEVGPDDRVAPGGGAGPGGDPGPEDTDPDTAGPDDVRPADEEGPDDPVEPDGAVPDSPGAPDGGAGAGPPTDGGASAAEGAAETGAVTDGGAAHEDGATGAEDGAAARCWTWVEDGGPAPYGGGEPGTACDGPTGEAGGATSAGLPPIREGRTGGSARGAGIAAGGPAGASPFAASSAGRSTPIRTNRSACGGYPSARTRRPARVVKTSAVSTTAPSDRPDTATISRTRRCPDGSIPRCTTRSTDEATVGTTNAETTFSPARSGRVQSFVTASRAELAWTEHMPGRPAFSARSRSCVPE